MEYFKLISLQGISRISEILDSICRLTNLRILDLGACHNLVVLPNGIGSLENLTHLDAGLVLDHMLKGLASLLKLQFLKGFVIGDRKSGSQCTLADLVDLKNLRKSSVSTGLRGFPTGKELTAFERFKALCKLTMARGGW
ncbi:hypothetical protein L1049_010038 [Liquidambar formosana]|uniref:Uncharacterized protein n=1 Tax=Liquidambar formosana TaxID=63359 RepID=A0AAP0N8J5_LIQFO